MRIWEEKFEFVVSEKISLLLLAASNGPTKNTIWRFLLSEKKNTRLKMFSFAPNFAAFIFFSSGGGVGDPLFRNVSQVVLRPNF